MKRSTAKTLLAAFAVGCLAAAAPPASAADGYAHYQMNQGTPYGLRADLTLRRPGLSGGQFYDNKLWANDGFLGSVLAGYRATAGGNLQYITQVQAGATNMTTVGRGSTTQASNTSAYVSIRASHSDYVVYNLPTGVFGEYAPGGSYEDLYARSYMVDNSVGLTKTLTSNLSYYTSRSGVAAAWYTPAIHDADGFGCAHLPSPVSLSAAHRNPCT